MRSVWLGVGIAAVIATSSAGAIEPEAQVTDCGHTKELAEAERALEEGRSGDALVHLRKADRLLVRCQMEGRPAGDEAPDAPRETADAGKTEALPAPPTSVS